MAQLQYLLQLVQAFAGGVVVFVHGVEAVAEVVRPQQHLHLQSPLPAHHRQLCPCAPDLYCLFGTLCVEFVNHLLVIDAIIKLPASVVIKCDKAILFYVTF